ncbi:vacuolar protein-sorting-associated protein 36-like [Centruroides sculpturatus]|uniref:vacuolar protein-sorting-associated protein 36-like n=1 Tax=Centruroides sculpturatus TaxID=218467 RepID=UPI000C6E514D|nr:vacuolar protein-sorting-associated protein 36-like [Centruroides sculpturatus]
MNRFVWEGDISQSEREITRQNHIRIYDGDEKTNFDNGELILTTHRFLWKDNHQREKELSLHLSLVVFAEKENRGWTRSGKIVVHLSQLPENQKSLGPVKYSPFNFVKFSFVQGGESEFFQSLTEVLEKKEWEKVPLVGISAKDMVNMSKTIAQKITEKKGCISEDETIQFKSHLLSLGISDPVTRDTHGTGDIYHSELAKQLVQILEKPLEDAGGILSLTDVYCRINRARGLELISPEDLVNACNMLETLNLPIKLHTFDSGVKVLKSASIDEHSDAEKLKELLTEHTCLSADELSRILNTTVILARERLLQAEKDGIACRDDSIEGLRFYPNMFLLEGVKS